MHTRTRDLMQLTADTQILLNYRLPLSFHPLAHAFDKGSGGQLLTECRSKLERESGRGLLAKLNLTWESQLAQNISNHL